MKLTDLIRDMNRLETELGAFERRFGVKSAEFHAAMNTGELEEFDGPDDFRMEFIEWLSLYKTWRSLNESRQLVARQPIAVQIKAHVVFRYFESRSCIIP